MSLLKKSMFFIDGENLVFGYQDMVNEGRVPLNGIKHEPDVYVWHRHIIKEEIRDILRVTYYTSAAGDYPKLDAYREQLHGITYRFAGEKSGGGGRLGGTYQMQRTANIVPKVYKSENRRAKSHAVDINIVIDVLNYASLDVVDEVYFLSGDGDYIPLIEAVMRKGKLVHVMALSNGLHDALPHAADTFECIDDRLFQQL